MRFLLWHPGQRCNRQELPNRRQVRGGNPALTGNNPEPETALVCGAYADWPVRVLQPSPEAEGGHTGMRS